MQASEALRNKVSTGDIVGHLVRHIDDLDWVKNGAVRWACAFGPDRNAQKLALFVAELNPGDSQVVSVGEREAVLYVLTGSGSIVIADENFSIRCGDGVYVRENEQFRLKAAKNERIRIVMAICPAGKAAPWAPTSDPKSPFDSQFPTRVVSADEAPSEVTGDRSFRVLVGPKTGSSAVTQFVGFIPQSRAPEHFHLYEEVICVLSGEGRMWMGEHFAPVRPGSLILLPRKQPHCMECTVPEGMKLLGMFYPSGSPAVNDKTKNEE